MIEPEVRERVPLVQTTDGAVLVEGTRVPLDVVVSAFQAGKAAEEIVLSYQTLDLADVYAVLTYYLRHQDEVDGYLAERKVHAGALRNRVQANRNSSVIRERLLARQRHR
ncbi:MAG: DUF433 domain-containing protein [Chloroflexi bacterium]|nr:DUF433 domain-containing protein [Chloroflexota bacterium]